MPAYEYELSDAGTFKVLGHLTAILPVAERDAVRAKHEGERLQLFRSATGEVLAEAPCPGSGRELAVKRAELPRRITIGGSAGNPEDIRPNVERLFYREEQRLGGEFERVAGMSKAEIRRVWAQPDPPEVGDSSKAA